MSINQSWRERLLKPSLTALLIVQVVLIFVVEPLSAMGLGLPGLLPSTFVLLAIATLLVALRSRAALAAVLFSVTLSEIADLIHEEEPAALTASLDAGARLVALFAVNWVVAKAVFGPGRVTRDRVQGAIVLYLNIGLSFFVLYRLVAALFNGAFAGLPPATDEAQSGPHLLYFSFTTLTTAGYGDITPINPIARSLANLESVIGQIYPATILARLIILEMRHRRS